MRRVYCASNAEIKEDCEFISVSFNGAISPSIIRVMVKATTIMLSGFSNANLLAILPEDCSKKTIEICRHPDRLELPKSLVIGKLRYKGTFASLPTVIELVCCIINADMITADTQPNLKKVEANAIIGTDNNCYNLNQITDLMVNSDFTFDITAEGLKRLAVPIVDKFAIKLPRKMEYIRIEAGQVTPNIFECECDELIPPQECTGSFPKVKSYVIPNYGNTPKYRAPNTDKLIIYNNNHFDKDFIPWIDEIAESIEYLELREYTLVSVDIINAVRKMPNLKQVDINTEVGNFVNDWVTLVDSVRAESFTINCSAKATPNNVDLHFIEEGLKTPWYRIHGNAFAPIRSKNERIIAEREMAHIPDRDVANLVADMLHSE